MRHRPFPGPLALVIGLALFSCNEDSSTECHGSPSCREWCRKSQTCDPAGFAANWGSEQACVEYINLLHENLRVVRGEQCLAPTQATYSCLGTVASCDEFLNGSGPGMPCNEESETMNAACAGS